MSRLLALVMVLSGGIGTKAFYYPDPETHSEEQFAEFIKSHPQYSMTSWFWNNDKGAKICTQKQAIEFAKKYGLNEFEVLDIWKQYHENENIDENYLLQKLIDINNEMGSWYKVVYKRISENQSIDIITFFTTQSRFFIFLN